MAKTYNPSSSVLRLPVIRHPRAAGRARSDLRIAETTAEAVAKSLARITGRCLVKPGRGPGEIYILTASGERGLEVLMQAASLK